jgi:hypothetical protein
MYNFSVKQRQVENGTVLDIHGKLRGCGGSGTLRDAINHPLEEGHNQILLNLAKALTLIRVAWGYLLQATSGRVTLNGIHGEFVEAMFEPVQYAVQ